MTGSLDAVEHPYDVDTSAIPLGDGRWQAQITDRWHTANGTPASASSTGPSTGCRSSPGGQLAILL